MALEAGKSKIKAPEDSVSGEGLFPGSLIVVFLLCSLMGQEVSEFPGASFIKALIPLMRAPPL